MQIQVKQSYKGKITYNKIFGPADYWSLTLYPVEYSDGYTHSEYLGVVHPVEYSDGYIVNLWV